MGHNEWHKPAKLLCSILLFVPLLTGCWDRLELEDRAVVLGISIDEAGPEAEEEETPAAHRKGSIPKAEMIRVNVQIGLPGRIPLGPGEGGGGGGGGGGGKESRTVWVLEVVGHSIDDALMNLQQQISGKLFFGHLRVIVVSEEYAKKGITNLNDYLRRNSEVRRAAWMAISKGRAKDLMLAVPKLERVPSLYLSATFDNAVKMGKLPTDYVGIFWSNASKKGQEGFLPYIQVMKGQNVEVSGLAYFRNDKLVGVTKPFEIISYMGIKGLNPAGYRALINMDGAPDIVTLYATHRKSKIDVGIVEGRPHFKVTVFVEINLEEKMSEHFHADNSSALANIQQKVKKILVQQYSSTVRDTQKKGSDMFGFGEYIRAKKPQYWNSQIQTKENWQEMYKTVAIDFSVEARIRRIGMKTR